VYPVSGIEGIEVLDSGAEAVTPIGAAEEIVRNMPNLPVIRLDANKASYSPPRDEVTIPAMQSFVNSEELSASP